MHGCRRRMATGLRAGTFPALGPPRPGPRRQSLLLVPPKPPWTKFTAILPRGELLAQLLPLVLLLLVPPALLAAPARCPVS